MSAFRRRWRGRAIARKTCQRRFGRVAPCRREGPTLRRARGLDVAARGRALAALRSRQAGGLRFRRQRPVGPWILDLYCAERKLAVELDGWSHNMGEFGRDARRDADLTLRGVRVVRISAAEAMANLDGGLAAILVGLQG